MRKRPEGDSGDLGEEEVWEVFRERDVGQSRENIPLEETL